MNAGRGLPLSLSLALVLAFSSALDAQESETPRQVVTERNPVATDTTFLYRFRKTPTELETPGGRVTLITTGLPTDHAEYRAIEGLADGDLVELVRAPAIKLRTEVPLRFPEAGVGSTLPIGNVADDYPGVYALWIRRVGDGWELLFNDEADAWGTQHDPAHDRLVVPAAHRLLEERDGRLTGSLEDDEGESTLRIRWGVHEWSAPFLPAPARTHWPHHGGDLAASRYAPLDQITVSNADRLEVVWRWTSPDEAVREAQPGEDRALRSLRHEGIPLVIDGVLYTVTSLSQLAAVDAATGETLWIYDPESWRAGPPTNLGFVHRGAAHWRDADTGHLRLLYATSDGWLTAIDAETGEPIGDFGDGRPASRGRVDLISGIPLARRPEPGRGRGNYTVSSPPLVVGDVAIVGSSIADRPNTIAMPRGDVRGFDARSGELLWTFHTIPQEGEAGNETWQGDSWRKAGNTNVWTLMSGDAELGLAYLPVSTPTSDYYGAHRKGAGLYAESLVALDAKTGRRVWHFQAVHHGLWDYDFPAAPNLVDLEVEGRPVRAVAQISKQGFTYVFDRETGEPIWPIEERPVPPSTTPGEEAWPTQPFPTRPPPFERQGTTPDNVIDFSPELRTEALAVLDRYDHGPLFTPPTERGNLQLPGSAGGGNWGGAAFDPEHHVLYVPSITVPIVTTVSKGDPARTELAWVGGREYGYGLREPLGPRGLPLFKPPYARVTAIDLDRGELLWQSPVGQGPRRRVEELTGRDPGPLGSSTGLVYALATRTLVLAAKRGGATPDDPGGLWAFDKATGELAAFVALDTNPTSSPVTYLEGGRQLVVVATTHPETGVQELVALALPDPG